MDGSLRLFLTLQILLVQLRRLFLHLLKREDALLGGLQRVGHVR